MAGGVPGAQRGDSGGIAALADLLDAHRGAFEHDWRARFSLPLTAIGTRRMEWGEAIRLMQALALDSSTMVAAALAGWDYPVSAEALVLMNVHDILAGAYLKKPEFWPRPWPDKVKKRSKPDASLTQEEIIAALRKAGHTAPIPTR